MRRTLAFFFWSSVASVIGGACAHGNSLGVGGSGGAGGVSPATGAQTSTAASKPSSASNGSSGQGTTSANGSPTSTTGGGGCGDGVCDATETCQSCPADCTCSTTSSATVATTGVTGAATTGSGAGCNNPCVTGPPENISNCMSSSYGPCVTAVCFSKPACCLLAWDQSCIDKTKTTGICGATGVNCP